MAVVALCVGLWAVPGQLHGATGASPDLNCADFGTRERAQREFEEHRLDVHDLDRDGDGRACEMNGSTGWWVWPAAVVGLVVGRSAARRRLGDYTMVPGLEGVLFNYRFDEAGNADKVPDKVNLAAVPAALVALPVMGLVRDHVMPRSATPIAVHVVTLALAGLVAWGATNTVHRFIGEPVASAVEDE